MKDYAKDFYLSKSWKQTSKAYLKSQDNLCERCGELAKICHHKKHLTPENISNFEIALSWENLEALCQECHNKEHHGKKRNARYQFDDEGNLLLPP